MLVTNTLGTLFPKRVNNYMCSFSKIKYSIVKRHFMIFHET